MRHEVSQEEDTMPHYPTFQPGDKVRTCYGTTGVVERHQGCMVWLVDEIRWWHPSKLCRLQAR